MHWRTEIEPISIPLSISHQNELVFLGSCFSESIGNKFLERKFKTVINPFGIIFNPISLAKLLLSKNIDQRLAFTRDGDLYNYLFQSPNVDLSSLLRIQEKVNEAKVVFLTLGTAFVHEHIETKEIVTNCHKQDSRLFRKRLLTVDEIVFSLNRLKEAYPKQTFIYTVSPIRHTREGLKNNQLSKSILRVAIDQLLHDDVFYFPSYEMMIDDLRDYRYYQKDMIHPSDLAIDYIWSKVIDVFFNEVTKKELNTIESIISRMNHKIMNPQAEDSVKFRAKLEADIMSSPYNWH